MAVQFARFLKMLIRKVEEVSKSGTATARQSDSDETLEMKSDTEKEIKGGKGKLCSNLNYLILLQIMLYSSAVLRSGKPQGITETLVWHSFWHCGLQHSPGARPWVLIPAPILPWMYNLRWVILRLCLCLVVFSYLKWAWCWNLSCGVTVRGKWHILIKCFLKSSWDPVSIQKC